MNAVTNDELFDEIPGRINHHDVRDDIERRVYEIALALLAAEQVAYHYRLRDTEYDEWREWEDCGECAFERFVEEEKCQGAGVQTRKLYTVPQVSAVPDGLVKAVRFCEQVKHENPPVETGAWKDAVDWVLKEACQVAGIRIKGECFDRKPQKSA